MMITKAVSMYSHTKSVKATARQLGVSHGKAMKLLVSAGIYPTCTAQRVHSMREQGLPEREICHMLNISRKALSVYTPYVKAVYGESISVNAYRIRQCRRRSRKTSAKQAGGNI